MFSQIAGKLQHFRPISVEISKDVPKYSKITQISSNFDTNVCKSDLFHKKTFRFLL